MSFRRFTCPSTGRLLHGPVNAATTAASSWSSPAANDRNSAQPESATAASHPPAHRPRLPDLRLELGRQGQSLA